MQRWEVGLDSISIQYTTISNGIRYFSHEATLDVQECLRMYTQRTYPFCFSEHWKPFQNNLNWNSLQKEYLPIYRLVALISIWIFWAGGLLLFARAFRASTFSSASSSELLSIAWGFFASTCPLVRNWILAGFNTIKDCRRLLRNLWEICLLMVLCK